MQNVAEITERPDGNLDRVRRSLAWDHAQVKAGGGVGIRDGKGITLQEPPDDEFSPQVSEDTLAAYFLFPELDPD